MFKRKPKVLPPAQEEEIRTKDFFDCVLPSTVKFMTDHYMIGDSYRCVWVIREYPPTTEEQAILAQLADRSGVTLRIYHRLVESMEQRKIVQNATRRNKLKTGSEDMNETIEAELRAMRFTPFLYLNTEDGTVLRRKSCPVHFIFFCQKRLKWYSHEALPATVSINHLCWLRYS